MRSIVLWDVMGTLVHDPFFVEMPEFFGTTFDAMFEAKHPSAWMEFELGQRSEEDFLESFFADGRDFDRRGFVRTVRSSYRWLPGVEELLAELGEAGCTMHAFSNYPVWYRLIEERLKLSRFLDWTFVSCITGLRKPDPAAYTHVLSKLRVPAERCVFVDDRNSNCEAARQCGIRSLRFDGVGPLRASLRDAGVL
ncbi:MAG: HAD family phosphatase [Deltaproteobacteria bacterium]|nr:HAD family phosphatase [Deltaproteobacteria bacterium]MBW1873918.1 HAD family phosphatase [Deltaproteobacteria bacterium]MBW2210128.1 HAD family phosphatase [Deltaproteobacteria bacterium]MBW2212939.1 HAD family phosphatase [Deltaproteobacteria bacterium]MBW2378101.1 HAD family phosphatase [Deltaproteobacteria bacterium]